MKTEDLRITQYALGELRGKEREEFEKELAQSEELQRELQETIAMCEQLQSLPAADEELLDEQRASLRAECLANVKVARRRIVRKKAVLWGGLGALAACLLLIPLTPWVEVSRFAGSKDGSLQEPLVASAPNADAAYSELTVTPLVGSESSIVALSSSKLKAGTESSTMAPAPATSEPVLESPVSAELAQSPPATPPASVGADATSRLVAEGKSFYEAGRFDLAAKRYNQALAENRYDIKARRGLEQVNEARIKYADQAFNEARERMTWTASLGWERPVTRFKTRPSTSISAPTEPEAFQASTAANGDRGPLVGRQFRNDKNDGWAFPVPSTSTETYELLGESPFLLAKETPLSTFSIDVDTASYSNVRRMLESEQLPTEGAVRVEELVNYFSYDYPQPVDGRPFSVNIETAAAPWAPQHELVRIGLKAQEIPKEDRGPANLVFLIDVSGSMNAENKLPLLKRSLQALVKKLAPDDQVALVVYAGSSGVVLPSTPGKERERILSALDRLQAGGGTNGAQGIALAYQTARESFLKDGNNRVILCTDGDFNVGVTSQDDLVAMIEKERASGVFLSVLGFGSGNLKDSTMEKLADKGNGNYAYIDTFAEGRKVLVEQMNSTLFTIAKDVKIQVEFNPAQVAGYRLIGYENRILAKEDFNDDKKDAGEIGSGHTVTALYEIVRAGQQVPDQPSVDPLKYQTPAPVIAAVEKKAAEPVSGDLLTVKLRYKAPDGDKSQLIDKSVVAGPVRPFDQASPDFQFATAVAAFGMKLRGSSYVGELSWAEIQKIARRNLGEDPGSYRAEFLTLVEKASRLDR